VLTCHACGWVAQCPHCDARLTWHAAAARLWCHHCGYQRRQPPACPECQGEDLRALGQGTERLEETLVRLFPETSLVRVDRDATRRKGSLEKALGAARSGEASLLVGTQMLAKGHHFPGVTLVGILDADAGLFGVDFRAPERTAQLLFQVAGRAGRAEKPGRVLIQTRHPDNPMLTQLIREGYGAFANAALEERRAAHLPPFSHQALVRAEAPAAEVPRAFLDGLAGRVRGVDGAVEVWGPVPAPMERRGGRYRAHLLLQADSRPVLQACLERVMEDAGKIEGVRRVRWSLDVDPVDLA
jgi:primosomal protein N' (replication factor Y)